MSLRGSHRLGGARLSHSDRICKDFNNDPLALMIENRSGVNTHMHMLIQSEVSSYISRAVPGGMSQHSRCSLGYTSTTSKRQNRNMVKNFSVEWLAQSCHDSGIKQEPKSLNSTQALLRPHVPCSVQPRPPTSYDKVYPQRKTNSLRTEHRSSTEESNEGTALFTPFSPRNCSSPNFSDNSDFSSGYESETTGSECASVEDDSEGATDHGTQRRIRTKFTPEQIDKLEKIFSKHKYLDAGERVKTALKLNLSETQVRTWFQNRRMKLKREVQEMKAEYLAPALPTMIFPPAPTVQYHFFSGQRPSLPPVPEMHMFRPSHLQQTIPHQMVSQASHPMFSMPYYY